MTHHLPDDHDDTLFFESPRGAVRYCRGCCAYELRFGNAIIALDRAEFDELVETIAELDRPPRAGDCTRPSHAVVWLGESGNGFRFTPEELSELHRLIAGARLFASLPPADRSSDSAID